MFTCTDHQNGAQSSLERERAGGRVLTCSGSAHMIASEIKLHAGP